MAASNDMRNNGISHGSMTDRLCSPCISNYKRLRHPRLANDWPMINGRFVAESENCWALKKGMGSDTVLIFILETDSLSNSFKHLQPLQYKYLLYIFMT